MEATKNDLSYDCAELDYDALITTARVAYFHSLNEIYRRQRILQCTDNNTERHLEAGWLLGEAKNLVIVAETLSTLLEGLKRTTIKIVNKQSLKGG